MFTKTITVVCNICVGLLILADSQPYIKLLLCLMYPLFKNMSFN